MKKLTTALLFIALVGFTIEKELTVKADLPTWKKHVNKLETVRNIVDESTLNNQEVKFITRTIDSLELLIIPQLNTQLDTTKKK